MVRSAVHCLLFIYAPWPAPDAARRDNSVESPSRVSWHGGGGGCFLQVSCRKLRGCSCCCYCCRCSLEHGKTRRGDVTRRDNNAMSSWKWRTSVAPIDTESSRECRQCCVCRVRMLREVDATSAGETLNAPEQNINTRSQPEQQMDAPPMEGPRKRNATNKRTKEPKPTEGSHRQSDWLNGQTAAPLQHWTPNSVDRVRPDWQTSESGRVESRVATSSFSAEYPKTKRSKCNNELRNTLAREKRSGLEQQRKPMQEVLII